MSEGREAVDAYLKALTRKLKTGDASEHTHRGALETLFGKLRPRLTVVNEPKRIECGAPDLIVRDGQFVRGHVETKDVGADLDRAERSDQLARYFGGLSNLILTDYLEFRWYTDGEERMRARLGKRDRHDKIVVDEDGIDDVLTLLDLFFDNETQAVRDPKELAARLAGLVRIAFDTITRTMAEEARAHASGHDLPRHGFISQLRAFREILIHDLDEEAFADMVAQTVAYGLFAARFEKKRDEAFTRERALFLIPATNPFLAKTFNHLGGIELHKNLHWVVDQMAELLNRTELDEIRRLLRSKSSRDDPIVYFYESFLAAYDPKLREARGVYYTPEPVVSYITRSVDEILKRDFGVAQGLADETEIEDADGGRVHKVQILDPAAGTGTFLHGVIEHIFHERFNQPGPRSLRGQWPSYVERHLLPRLHGFEYLMAPYVIGHLKLNLTFKDTGYDMPSGRRVNLFLTNTLEDPAEEPPHFPFGQWLAEEADAARGVKRDTPVLVVLGNPPYSGNSQNPSEVEVAVEKGDPVEHYKTDRLAPVVSRARRAGKVKQRTFIGHLLKGWDPIEGKPTGSYFHIDGKPLGERNPKWLQDDYVKFIRFSQWRIERTGHGVLGFITNNGYLDNPTFRGMRKSLLETFDDLYILDLHGNAKKKETAPDGGRDQNVFDIMQGVAIAILVKKPEGQGKEKGALGTVHHADLWGEREAWEKDGDGVLQLVGGKYRALFEGGVSQTDWRTADALPPMYFFQTWNTDNFVEFEALESPEALYQTKSLGVVAARDALVIDFDRSELATRLSDFSQLPIEEARQRYELRADSRDWSIKMAQADLRGKDVHETLQRIAYRPFDSRSIAWTGKTRGIVCMPRTAVMQHLLHENLALTLCGQTATSFWGHVLVADEIVDNCLISNQTKERGVAFPLYEYPSPDDPHAGGFDFDGWPAGPGGRRPNLERERVAAIEARLGLRFVSDGRGDLAATFGPEDLLHWIYAVLHAPSYRARYAEFLKSDFPRIPFPADPAFFKALCALGARLVDLHLLRDGTEREAVGGAGGGVDRARMPGFPEAGDDGVHAARGFPGWERLPDAEQPEAEGEKGPLGRVAINPEQSFTGVPKAVYEFRVGGYQVLEKWLKDRRGRTLSADEIERYRRIVAALDETIDLMAAIDAAIEDFGGWPIV